jgi:hypothetical protein
MLLVVIAKSSLATTTSSNQVPIFKYKPLTMSSRALVEFPAKPAYEVNLIHQFKTNEVELDNWDINTISKTLFSKDATNNIVGSFDKFTSNKDINKDFLSQFSGTNFNYEYSGSRKTLRDLQDRDEQEEYELRKAFAKHIQYELGEYHFNKFVKYHPRIQKYVKKAEDINVTITLVEPKEPGKKPTKIKLRADPFRKELKLKYTSPIFDSVVRYKLSQQTIAFNIQKAWSFVSMAINYDLVLIDLQQRNFQQNFSLGLGKNIYKNIALNLSLSGRYMNKENLNLYTEGQMNSLGAFLAIGMPL